jgi:putative oxidoreductase
MNIFQPTPGSLWASRSLSLLRIVSGLVYFVSGSMKVFHYPAMPGYPMPPFNPASLMGAAGLIEVIGGILIALGLFTRPAAFICSGQMAAAYFMGHAAQSLFPQINQGMPALLLCFVFFHFIFAGAGSVSVDALIARRRHA